MSQDPSTDVCLLLVDDLPENLFALEPLVRGPGRRVFTARSGEQALSLMLEQRFALAIIDVQMPEMDGFELAELMRGTERTRHIPIVFVTAAGHELNYAFRGYEAGAVDVLYKPLDPHAVRSKVNVFVDLFRQQQDLLRMQAELGQAVRVRDDFMSMVSHELRNPLNALYLQAQLRGRMAAQGKLPPVDEFQRLAARDEHQIRAMIRLLDDMLDVSRARTGRLAMSPAPMNLAELVRRAADGVREQARTAGVALTLAVPETLPVVADEFRIEQVVMNLLTNALRYGARQPVTVRLEPAGGEAVLSVRDEGPGIDPADQERIFRQFERGASGRQVPGLGLGLYISRQIAEAHGGRLDVRSRPGHGAEFTLRLPLQAQPA
ncbi:hybrid sensor histidine kinase/response regulator [Ramlibacter tataouinensis]|uniref:hybrid sensor histidine kinase/response regulator n=1 Tax=Ramlibacter tataouinensis TaxID=94132 RepID=UPI0022F3D70B|nr:hybrid sensor histidine kinase/response regulator [Ramlibacter tataouinensis]WBY03112.1 hybrid sensor histidine kinase/response regulator [Ramlibacter tataouinensis]